MIGIFRFKVDLRFFLIGMRFWVFKLQVVRFFLRLIGIFLIGMRFFLSPVACQDLNRGYAAQGTPGMGTSSPHFFFTAIFVFFTAIFRLPRGKRAQAVKRKRVVGVHRGRPRALSRRHISVPLDRRVRRVYLSDLTPEAPQIEYSLRVFAWSGLTSDRCGL